MKSEELGQETVATDRSGPAARYFVAVAARVFDDYFEQLGAHRVDIDATNVVLYESDSWFAEVLYFPKDGPNYLPRVMSGCCEEMFEDPRRNRVDIMHTAGNEEHSYNLRWPYRDRYQLEASLNLVRDRIVDVFTKPYLADVKRLRSLLVERRKVVEAQWKHPEAELRDIDRAQIRYAKSRAGLGRSRNDRDHQRRRSRICGAGAC